MSVVHISEEEAVRDFAAVLAKVDAGDRVMIDRNEHGILTCVSAAMDSPLRVAESQDVPEQEKLTYLSEFRERHAEAFDGSKWD